MRRGKLIIKVIESGRFFGIQSIGWSYIIIYSKSLAVLLKTCNEAVRGDIA